MKTYLMLGAAALALTACKLDRSPTAAPQFAAAAPFDLGLAPGYDALPTASQPIPVYYAPQPVAQDYWNNAYSQGQGYYDQPPSYFPYNGATPLVWNQGSMITRIVEALVGGGQREYYYQPGAAYPYFVRDPQYAYAYNDGRLIAAYDPYGQPLAETVLLERAPIASRYLVRAETLYDVARRTSPRPLTREVWTVERTRLARQVEGKPWKTWWTPGDNRSPVAVQRLAEVRQRKLERDLAHTEWMKEQKFAQVDRKAAKFDDRRPDIRVEAAPPGQRVHAVVAPAERRVDVRKVEVRKVEPQTRKVEVRKMEVRKVEPRALKPVEMRKVEARVAPERARQVRAAKVEKAKAAVEHGRPAAFHGPAKTPKAAAARAPAKGPTKHGKKHD